MISVEQRIKNQYAKFFKQRDWQSFKIVADYYLMKGATLRKADIDIDETFQLLMRNIQKRLFLGIGTELLLKACYLKHGYTINKATNGNNSNAIKSTDIRVADLDKKDTLTFSKLVPGIHQVIAFENWPAVEKGLRILKTFRNKEGHVVSLTHRFDPQNYRDIEGCIIPFYKDSFDEELEFRIAMQPGEQGRFSVASNE